jgi:catechol 2,3-dioxygenase-like lactoylglutathione lyase family enzyme
MFSHITIGTNDLARAIAFYDAILAPLGIERAPEAAYQENYIGHARLLPPELTIARSRLRTRVVQQQINNAQQAITTISRPLGAHVRHLGSGLPIPKAVVRSALAGHGLIQHF